MSRNRVAMKEKINQMRRKGRDDFHVLVPTSTVKGKGRRGGWRLGDKGIMKFPAVNTNQVCTQAMSPGKAERVKRDFK